MTGNSKCFRSSARSRVEDQVHACMLSCFIHVWIFETLWNVAHQAPLSMEFSRKEYWNGLSFPSPGDLPDPRLEPESLTSPVLAGELFTTSAIPFQSQSWYSTSIVFSVLVWPVFIIWNASFSKSNLLAFHPSLYLDKFHSLLILSSNVGSAKCSFILPNKVSLWTLYSFHKPLQEHLSCLFKLPGFKFQLCLVPSGWL